jgi:rubredoxin
MQSTRRKVLDINGNEIPSSRALTWGNNAAWLCPVCGDLLGSNTLEGNHRVECSVCGAPFEIDRSGPGKAADGVRRCKR